MAGLILFIISFCLVLSSSYFLASTIKSRRFENSIIYLVLILVSQIIVSVEILSIIKQINQAGILISNLIIFIPSLLYWKYKEFPHIDFGEIKLIKDKIIQAIKKDKILLLLAVFFVFSSLVSLLLTIITPTNSWDSLIYHLARIGFWVQNQTLAHFESSSIRHTIYSINSEILILWSMVFLKRDYLAQLPQYLAYLGCIFTIFTYLRYLKVSTGRILWTIFILASFPAVILESTSAQTDLLVAFFLLASLYLFIYGVRENSKKALIFSAIAFSIDAGIKYSTFFFVPVFGIIFFLISIRENKKLFYKPIAVFIAASIPAFLVLSSYNHILNYLDFGNFFANQAHMERLGATPGFKTLLANLIRYFLLFIDFSGIESANILSPLYLSSKDFLFSIFGLQNTDGLAYVDIIRLNTFIQENHSKFGLLGFLLLPALFIYSLTKLKSKRNKTFYLNLTSLVTIIFLVSVSLLMGFCYWNNRFLLTSIVISSTILAFSYTRQKNIFKILITIIAILNFAVISTSNDSKPLFKLNQVLNKKNFVSFRNEVRLRDERFFSTFSPFYYLLKYIGSTAPDNSKIGLIFSDQDCFYPFFEENPSWKIYPIRYDLLVKRGNYNDYDYLIISGEEQGVDITNEKEFVFNYTVKDNQVIYNQVKPNEPIILYFDIHNNILTEGKPAGMTSIIDFSNIPANFKLVKKIEIIENYKQYKTEKHYKFFIYKKLNNT
ncbi:MAG: hypothetical protein A2287_09920 [Candidatus Melainabacteria bacterium RIFOXYA12_FULL_32_12]|nr:MAG: hypothetical protein A2255_01195 [Candidatus Melainabacteria bacterium RIFOXYA2_FULL_32_9]OGI31145.1 MAG: hypothetical protein A2287_09920 [Candidatus Melainabacteria bacterium RIFOXYA12_FULL_32_12]